MENNLEKLIGAQLVSIDENSVIVNLNGRKHELIVCREEGDCCGYTNVLTELYYSPNDDRNPIITDIKLSKSEVKYGGEYVRVNFYGENKELALMETKASSGTGYVYGSCVWFECKSLELSQDLATW